MEIEVEVEEDGVDMYPNDVADSDDGIDIQNTFNPPALQVDEWVSVHIIKNMLNSGNSIHRYSLLND